MNRFLSYGLLTVLALSLSACVFLTVGDGAVHAEGAVSDSAGYPIADAFVFFDAPGRKDYPSLFEGHTRSDGRFRLSSTVAPGRYNIPLIIQASGYRQAALRVPTLKRNMVEITLEQEGSPKPSRMTFVPSK